MNTNNLPIDDGTLEAIDRRIQAILDSFEEEEDCEETETRAVESFWEAGLPENKPGPYDVYGGLSLQLVPKGSWSFREDSITGQFMPHSRKYSFSLFNHNSAEIVPHNPRLRSLLDYFAKDRTPLRLFLTKTDAGEIYIRDLCIEAHPSVHNRLSDEVDSGQTILKRVLVQLLTSRVAPQECADYSLPSYNSKEELQFLFESCKPLYPPYLAEWIQTSFVRFESKALEKDERQHILKALTYVLNIDWTIKVPNIPPQNEIKKMLDAEFYGLETVKQRVLEIAAQLRRCEKLPKWGILLAGPAGVGKTTISRAITRILGLPMVQMDMNTIKDPESLTGSSRIYSNAKAGLVIEKLYSARSANVTMLINELDKAGDSSDTLLTLVDKLGFADVFLETTIPTDGIFFIATCNETDKISKPLLDRFLRIDIPPYSPSEKKVIMERYIIPRMLRENALPSNTLSLSNEALDMLCSGYAVEPGVRDLEQFAEKFLSHFLSVAESNNIKSFVYGADDIKALLGPMRSCNRKFRTCAGMAISGFMHEGRVHTIPVEAIVVPGSGNFSALNIKSETVRDYAHAAYLAVRRLTPKLSNQDVTVFIPQQTPDTNDNFIGIATAVAIASALGNQNLSAEAAFIGGVDLFGNTYSDDTDITGFVNAFAGIGIERVYAPLGASRLLYGSCPSGVQIVEALNLEYVIELAARSASAFNAFSNVDSEDDFDIEE